MSNVPLERARCLRINQTHTERLMWDLLRGHRFHGWKWKRQAPRGRYIVDFYCAKEGLVLELDGPQHADQVVYDARRTRYLNALGLRVIRCDSNLVIADPEALCTQIYRYGGSARFPSPNLSPPCGERDFDAGDRS